MTDRAKAFLAKAWAALGGDPAALPSLFPVSDLAGDYPARDGWIGLHTNAPHRRKAALAVLGCSGQREQVAEADLSPNFEHTSWGEARRLLPPLEVVGAPLRWGLPARDLGTSSAIW